MGPLELTGREAEPLLGEAFDIELEPVARDVDRVLAVMPKNPLEARRLITRELGFDPDTATLETVIQIAHDTPPRSSIRRFARTALVLLVLGEREVRYVLRGPWFDAGRLDACAERARKSVRCATELRDSILEAAEDAFPEDADLLQRLAQALVIPLDALTAARVLAPRLATFAWSTTEQALVVAVHSLSDTDLGVLVAALGRRRDDARTGNRAYLNALALRTILEDDLESLLVSREDGDAPDVSAESLERDRVACRVVTDELLRCLESARAAGLDTFVRELERGAQMLRHAWEELQCAQVRVFGLELVGRDPADPL